MMKEKEESYIFIAEGRGQLEIEMEVFSLQTRL